MAGLSFDLTDEQIAFRKSVVDFAERVVRPGADERDRDGRFDRQVWDALGEFGLLGLPIPEEYGGQGADILTTCLALEALEEGGCDAGLNLSVGGHITIGTVPIWLHGNEEQKSKYLPRLCSGEWIGAFAVTEPDAGSDAAGIKTRAMRDGEVWRINGSKTFITNGSIADVLLVMAVTNPEVSPGRGISCFILEPKGLKGFSVGKDFDKSGQRSSPLSLLHFDDVEVPAENMLSGEGEALWRIAFECFDWERTVMVASGIGGMEGGLKECLRYVKERTAFGKPIAEFQLIQEKLARMRVNLEAARWVLYRAAWLKQEGRPHQVEASIAKYMIAELSMQNALEAVQIFGGYGYIKETPIERAIRDSKLASIGGGTSEIQKLIIAKELLGGT